LLHFARPFAPSRAKNLTPNGDLLRRFFDDFIECFEVHFAAFRQAFRSISGENLPPSGDLFR
jgi:hypothetical protein